MIANGNVIEIRRERTGPGCTGVLEALAHRTRRRVLRVLGSVGDVHVEDLVGTLAAGDHRSPRASGTADLAAVRIELQHYHLPKLVDAELVSLSEDRVSLVSRDVVDDPVVAALLRVETDDWDEVLDCLACPRRRSALSALAATDGSEDLTALAFQVAEREGRSSDDAASAAVDVDRTLLELRHVHLPKLAALDLVAFDDEASTARYLGHPALDDIVRTRGGSDGARRRIPL